VRHLVTIIITIIFLSGVTIILTIWKWKKENEKRRRKKEEKKF